MNELGEVMHLSKSGRIIVRLQKDGKQIKNGQLLVDASGKRIGKVIEVIGPVKAPYASVAPFTDRIKKLLALMYLMEDFWLREEMLDPVSASNRKAFDVIIILERISNDFDRILYTVSRMSVRTNSRL